MFKRIQSYVISLYRTISISILLIIITGVLSYLFLLGFYLINTSWAIPLILSPSQPKVLSFQPQIASLTLGLSKQRSELKTALMTKENIIEQIDQIDKMSLKIKEASNNEKNRSLDASSLMIKLLNKKNNNIAQTSKTLGAVKLLLDQTDEELKAGLITKDQAAQRKITLQGAINNYTDLSIASTQIEAQTTQLVDYVSTLAGNNKSLNALVPTKTLMELDALKSQLKLQLDSGERSIDILKKSMAADNRILQVAMDSPYYSALFSPTPVIFITYDNMERVEVGSPVYDCYLQVIFCRRVGEINKIYSAEEYAKHPLFKSDLRGKFATVNFTDKDAARSAVLFVNNKPLLI